jgi:hypothetical protein
MAKFVNLVAVRLHLRDQALWGRGVAYGFISLKAAIALRSASPARVKPIAVGAPGGKMATCVGGELRSNKSANPWR